MINSEGYYMKKLFLTFVVFLLTLSIVSAESTVNDEFCGCIKKVVVDKPLTVSWIQADNADGCELKIIHYFYEGLETEVVETDETSYTFNNLPKSSRHFEVKARSFNNRVDGTREYSVWVSSTDKNYAEFNGVPCGWLIYTTPGTPSW